MTLRTEALEPTLQFSLFKGASYRRRLLVVGLLAAVEFIGAIGMDRIEGRIRYLRSALQSGLGEIEGLSLATPDDEELATGMVSFRMEGVSSLDLQAHLARAAKVRTRVISEYGYDTMRLSTHVYNRPSDLERVLELLDEATQSGVPARDGEGEQRE